MIGTSEKRNAMIYAKNPYGYMVFIRQIGSAYVMHKSRSHRWDSVNYAIDGDFRSIGKVVL